MIKIETKTDSPVVLAAGQGWMAVDKPTGMSVHNAPGKDLCSVAREIIVQDSALRARMGLAGLHPLPDLHPVHRLDRETSGVTLLAADPVIFRFFSEQFNARTVRKIYTAILHGRLEPPMGSDEWGLWEWPLSKSAGGRAHPQGPTPRQPSRTRYRVMDHSVHYTLVALELLTGRTHQIRRHAKLAGHPVVGDGRYGSDRAIRFLKEQCGFARLALHARSLTIQLPDQKEPFTIETPHIPEDMRLLFENDRISQ